LRVDLQRNFSIAEAELEQLAFGLQATAAGEEWQIDLELAVKRIEALPKALIMKRGRQ